jgi:hypothetical protein
MARHVDQQQHNKLQLVQPWYSGVAVIQLHQKGGNHTYMPSNGTVAWHTCSCCKVFPHLLLHTVVCSWPFHTSRSSGHFLTKARCCHCQGMCMTCKEMTHMDFMVSWWPCLLNWSCAILLFEGFLCIYCFKDFTRPHAACISVILARPLLLFHFRSLSAINLTPDHCYKCVILFNFAIS